MAFQQCSGKEAQVRLAGHQGVVGETRVSGGVGYDEQTPLQNGMRTDRDIERGLAHPEPLFRLEPLPVAVNEVDDGDGSLADERSHLDDIIKR